ncbi:flavin reductase family protein [Aliidiomarina sedimenti]|uniref:Flavin reductase family protein n=1 Tax=Aliidiomarina sedimenti TaxID=1933879 RepID=A0ABY0C1L7_9GAMM|nr:flavin reductase family protein [Aliidiomarina sedimenti]RUO31752.1 flavin reductase family protein [Aliidiomarina sedimenti]
MILSTDSMSPEQIYHTTVQTLLPRPIAWVLTEHESGHYNLAPFSYFTAISSDPALLMFSVGDKAPGEGKDTKVNIARLPYFTVHIPSFRHAEAVTETSRTLPAEQSELQRIGLQLTDFEGFSMPRLADCSVAFGCSLHDIQPVKGAPQSMVFGRVEHIYIADQCARNEVVTKADGSSSQRLTVDATAIDPLARLGGNQYGRLGETLSVPRPR